MNTQTQILDSFKQKAIHAHNWTSFSPDVRGNQMIKDYSEELTSDLQELESKGIEKESLQDYEARYKRFFSSYLNAKGNCFSAMITGPANFNTRRHEKANRSEQKHYEVFREWRERAKKAIVRKAQPAKTFESEIDRYKRELEGMKANHDLMKQGNKRILQARKTGEDLTQYLTETFNILPHMIDWTLKFGFGLANNNANMKRVEARIKELENKEQNANEVGQDEVQYNGFKVVVNHIDDRIQIIHDTKPPFEVTQLMKSHGMKWTPSKGLWQRQLTVNAKYSIFKLLIPKLTSL